MARRIYIVDDLQDFLDFAEDLLLEQGYEVTTFLSAGDAVQAAGESAPDLIITDLRMGEESGFDLLQALLDDPHTRNVPVLLCTAATMDVEERGPMPGKVGIVYKPFEIPDFLSKVEEFLPGER